MTETTTVETHPELFYCHEHAPHTSWCADPCIHDACPLAHPRPFAFYPAQRDERAGRTWGVADDLSLAVRGAESAAKRERVAYLVYERHADLDGTAVETEVEYVAAPV